VPSITIRNLDERTKSRLRLRAALAEEPPPRRPTWQRHSQAFRAPWWSRSRAGAAGSRTHATASADEQVIVVDTNVLSELMKPRPTQRVVEWVAARLLESLYTTCVTQAEILHDVMRLPPDRRRRGLEKAAEAMFREDFAGRLLPFGSAAAAQAYAVIAVARGPAARPIAQLDAQSAGIARSVGATIATRVELVDPWQG